MAVIADWHGPRILHTIRQSLRFCSNYRWYIKDFVAHESLLHELTVHKSLNSFQCTKLVAFPWTPFP